MKRLRSMLVLFIVAIGCGTYIYFVERHREPALEEEPNEQVFSFESEDLTELHITGTSEDTTELHLTDETWKIISPIEANVDETTLSSITSSLSSLEITRVVEEAAVALEPFGLLEPTLDIGFRLTDTDIVERLFIGEETPIGSDRYAKLNSSDRIFLIDAAINTTFDKTTFDLRNKQILEITGSEIDRLNIKSPNKTMELVKEGNDWRMIEPIDVRADFSTVQALVGRLDFGIIQSIESENSNDLNSYGLSNPSAITTLSTGNASATLHIGTQSPGGASYARDTSRNIVFTISASLVAELNRDPSEYRRKELFGFRPFNATRLEVEQAGNTMVFEKTTTTTTDEDHWKLIQPQDLDLDSSEMDDLLSKLSILRAQSWIESRNDAGLEDGEQFVTVRAHFGEEETEDHVIIWRTDGEVFAVHGNEPGAAKIDADAFDEALVALETVQAEDS